MDSNWNWGPAFNRVINDINVLAWLVAEDKYARQVGISASVAEAVDDVKHAASCALVGGSESEVRDSDAGRGGRKESKAPAYGGASVCAPGLVCPRCEAAGL